MARVTLRRLWLSVVSRSVRVAQLCALLPLLVAVVIGLWATSDLPGPPLWAWLAVPLAVLAGLRLTAVLNAGRVDEALAAPETTIQALARRIPGMGTGESTRARPEPTGITEIDELADAVQRRAVHLTQMVTSQRRLAGDAAHQLRTPLSALTIRLDELALAESAEEARELADGAHTQVERLTAVVEEMLESAKSSALASTDVLSLDEIIAAQQHEWQPLLTSRRRGMRVTGAYGVHVACPRGVLSQVLSTLIENSITYGAGIITLHIEHNGPSVQLVLSDEGPGIAPDIADRIFERDVTAGAGTGRGLALARQIISAVGGRLELLDERHATFGVFLSEPAESPTR
ncbi:sensor histidine kinase [Kytococcus sp. Marseille-QA3725]